MIRNITLIVLIIVLFVVIYIYKPNYIEKLLRKLHYRAKSRAVDDYIIPNISEVKHKDILDFGSGSGALSHSLENKLKESNITSLDVEDKHEYGKSPIIYEGDKIPFNKDKFDIVICYSVLHHIPDQMKTLDELIRVCKKRLLIMEDCNDTALDKFLTWIHGYSSYGKCNDCFHSREEWIKIFRLKGLKIRRIINLPRSTLIIYPVCRRLFVLDK